MRGDVQPRVFSVRRVFPAWSIHIPPTFDERFLTEPDYWHAWDEDRSVSRSGFVVADDCGPVPVERPAERVPRPHEGTPVNASPAGLLGWAVEADADPTSGASRAISGILAADGRLLLATITGDDQRWLHSTWMSIRHHEAPFGIVRPVLDSYI